MVIYLHAFALLTFNVVCYAKRTPLSCAKIQSVLTQPSFPSDHMLLHGHGEVVVGASIPQVVDRCIQLDLNARVEHEILAMGGKPVYLQPPANAAAVRDVNRRAWDAWMREENNTKR